MKNSKTLIDLTEKAEKWDEAIRINVKIGGGKPISCVDMAKKLEAVKNHLTKWVSGHSDWQMGRMSQWKDELVKILEDEG